MRDLPLVIRAILNVILYFFYLVFFSLIFSFSFPVILKMLEKPIMNPADPLFVKIQIFIAILVLLISLIWRKYFYICGRESENMIILEEQVVKKKPRLKDIEDEDFKIFVDRKRK